MRVAELTRYQTLRLLLRLSPELLDTSFQNLLSALRTSTDLSLPLNPPTSLEEKTTAGRLETSSRALEVSEIKSCRLFSDTRHDAAGLGSHFGADFVEILLALNEGVVNSTVVLSGSEGRSTGGQVWEEGLRRVSAILNDSKSSTGLDRLVPDMQQETGSSVLASSRK